MGLWALGHLRILQIQCGLCGSLPHTLGVVLACVCNYAIIPEILNMFYPPSTWNLPVTVMITSAWGRISSSLPTMWPSTFALSCQRRVFYYIIHVTASYVFCAWIVIIISYINKTPKDRDFQDFWGYMKIILHDLLLEISKCTVEVP